MSKYHARILKLEEAKALARHKEDLNGQFVARIDELTAFFATQPTDAQIRRREPGITAEHLITLARLAPAFDAAVAREASPQTAEDPDDQPLPLFGDTQP